jgi:hypothetical protein
MVKLSLGALWGLGGDSLIIILFLIVILRARASQT